MPARLTLALGALLCALFACTSSALAATQTKDDAAGEPPLNYIGEHTDLRQATWDVTADTVTLDLTMTNGYLGRYYVFLDTNKDGKSGLRDPGQHRQGRA